MAFIKGRSGNPAGRPKGAQDKWTVTLREKAMRYGVDALEVCHGILMNPEESTKDRLKAAEVILKPAAVQVQDITPAGITVNLGFITAGTTAKPELTSPTPKVMTLVEGVVVAPEDQNAG
jgi:hypothetical protein